MATTAPAATPTSNRRWLTHLRTTRAYGAQMFRGWRLWAAPVPPVAASEDLLLVAEPT